MTLMINSINFIIQMSDVNALPPLQLIRLRDNVFQVPEQTKQFLRGIKNPLGVLTIVGKYRTGKSLFLNKVLLKKSSFKVSPTINSCTKGLWMCRETLQTQGSDPFDVLVIDTEGFGATEETDAYNNKIMLFAILLSSYFVYNSVGSIDENSINNLNVIANLAKDIQQNNSKDDKLEEEFPSFLWLVRDFTLNMVDKCGNPIQAKEYLQQALENLKGNSDSIENKNKIRRLIKHFFKDRDCCTLVRPVETQGQLQTLFALPDQDLRPQFLQQAGNLRSKILKKIKAKRIRGKTLNGQSLLELVLSYVDVINKGSLPNFQSSYRLIMRFQLNKLADEFLQSCKQRFTQFSRKLRTKEEFDDVVDQLNLKVEERFREGAFEAEQTKMVTERIKKEIRKYAITYSKDNEERVFQNCREIWQKLYTSKNFDDQRQIKEYFEKIQHQFKKELGISNNPVDTSHYTAIIEEEKCKQLEYFIHHKTESASKEIMMLQNKVSETQIAKNTLEVEVRELKEKLFEANRQNKNLNARYLQLERSKQEEIGLLRQRQADNLKQIQKYHFKSQEYQKEIEHLHNKYTDLQLRYQETHDTNRTITEERRQLLTELDVLKSTLQHRSQEALELKMKLHQTTNLFNSSKEHEAVLEAKIKMQADNHSLQLKQLQSQNQRLALELGEMSKKASTLQEELRGNSQSISRERTIYENMFESFKESLKSQATSRQQLIQTNKNLSSALKHLENRAIQAQQKENQLKSYKRCVKNSSCLQCQHCTKFFGPTIFINHLNNCVLGPEALKNAQSKSESEDHEKLELKIKQTLIREEQSKPFTEYVIELKRGNKCWTVYRKYKAFCDLNSVLRAILPGVELSQCSHIVNPQQFSKKSLAIQERRRALQRYMLDLSSKPLVTATNAWREFIQQSPQPEQSSPLTETKDRDNKKSSTSNNQQTPQQFFKLWNQRKLRGKELSMSKKFKPNG